MIWAFPIQITAINFLMESFHNDPWNGVLIVERKENMEAGAICFEVKIPRKKQRIIWFVNTDSTYCHQVIRLLSTNLRSVKVMNSSDLLNLNVIAKVLV